MSQQTPRVLNRRTDTIPPGAIYVGRPSKWGNPFTHLSGKTLAQFQVKTVGEAVAAYRRWVLEQPELMAALHELRDKDLECWCAPGPCHADVLVELANAPEAPAPTYAGIGSRRTPEPVLELITTLASQLAQCGHVLRSGHAPGADQAFERGAGSQAEIYLPWPRFEASVRCAAGYVQPHPSPEAVQMAATHHPAWDRLRRGARSLHARNCHQILGRDLEDPVSFVVCWTPDGATTNPGPSTGGTGQALRIAAAHGIPIFNLARPEDLERVRAYIATTA